MYKNHTIAVVVPAYNEAGFIGTVLKTVPEFVDRVYVIDDCSTDTTWQEITAVATELNHQQRHRQPSPHATDGGQPFSRRIVPIQHETNKGVGGALKTGYNRAYADGIDVTAVMAGDGQMDPEYLDTLIDPIVEGKADYAKGNRFLHSTSRKEMPQFRLVGNWMLSLLTKFASGYWQTGDPQNGYTAISRNALATLDIDALYDRYGFANELLARLNCHNLRVADVAMPAVYGEEESDIQYHTFIPAVSNLLSKLFLWRLNNKYRRHGEYTIVSLYLLSLGSVLAAGLRAITAATMRTDNSSKSVRSALLCLLTGVTALGSAVYAEWAQHSELETQITPSTEDEE